MDTKETQNMTGIRYFKLKGKNIASYGWHQLHTGKGFMKGCGIDVKAKYLTIGKLQIVLKIQVD